MSDADKKRMMNLFDKVSKCKDIVLEFDEYNENSIKNSLAVLDYLAPSKVEVDYNDIENIKIPFVKRFADEKEERYREVYRVNAVIKEYPFIYHLLFDQEQNIRPNAVTNIANYLNYQTTEEMDDLATKFRTDALDYNLDVEYKYEITKQFFSSLKLRLETVELPSNNLDEQLEQATYLYKIRTFLEENDDYYHDEDKVDEHNYDQDKNIKSYTLGKL